MKRAVVNVATGHYVKGQDRLLSRLALMGEDYVHWRDCVPNGSPEHSVTPYAFKAHALMQAWAKGFTTLLWCDASILPIKPLTPLWNRIESDGYWISRNGWTNYEWTADSAYPELFPTIFDGRLTEELALQRAREVNKQIPHVVATTFGVSMEHEVGREFLQEYLKLANGSAFNGPWTNSVTTRCGSQEVLGHRHDQTAASVIAWRLGCALTNPPEYFAYSGGQIDKTILLADGAY